MLCRFLILLAGTSIAFCGNATTFTLNENSDVLGHNLVVYSKAEDTLLDIARQFDLGYGDIVNANPDVDPWLPGEGSRVLLPTRFILPAAPKQGIVINLAELRLYYFPKSAKNEVQKVITHPIGIGREGWATPLGIGRIIQKIKDPTWTPPESIRIEHAEKGDPLPKVVPAGPNNPLGAFAMRLSIPGYLLHGTDKPFGVGMRVSHGCIRLFPEDIEHMFSVTPNSTPVNILYQPHKAGLRHDQLFLESHPNHNDIDEHNGNNMTPMVSAIVKVQEQRLSDEKWPKVETIVREKKGVVLPIDGNTSDIIEDVWFLHPGYNQESVQKVRLAMQRLEMQDLFWPISAGAEGELLIGPFNSRDEAQQRAKELSHIADTSLWLAQVSNDAL